MHAFTKQYSEVAVPKLKELKKYASVYQIPRVEKVVLNVGIGSLQGNGKAIEEVAATLAAITGQKPIITKATKAISGFKVRQGMDVGMKVTLRGTRMNDFLIKLTQIALPRTRDFRGIKPSSVATNGSLHLGIKDCTIFPEANQDTASHGIQVSVVVTPCTSEEAHALYGALGFVFQSNQ